MGRKLAWWMKGRMKDFALRVSVRFAELSNELALYELVSTIGGLRVLD